MIRLDCQVSSHTTVPVSIDTASYHSAVLHSLSKYLKVERYRSRGVAETSSTVLIRYDLVRPPVILFRLPTMYLGSIPRC